MITEISNVTRYPLLVFALSLVVLSLSSRIGWSFLRRRYPLEEEIRKDFSLILGASLTLLALIMGFTFSMATNRYDQRKNFEEAEANAIGTEYLRAGLLPAADGTKVRTLLSKYLDGRIRYYVANDEEEARQINVGTNQLQDELWSAVLGMAAAQPTPVVALVVSGMNDVLNSQGYTQAAWWNRIPAAAWGLMAVMAVGCNLLIGYGSRGVKSETKLLLILPVLCSIAFMLIADIDSPRRGIIRVIPQNLISVAESLHTP
jgi:hypothetical protein